MGNGREGAAVIFDNGSSTIKAGRSGEHAPTVVLPSVVGEPKTYGMVDLGWMVDRGPPGPKPPLVGDKALKKAGMCELRYPMERGYIQNVDDMVAVWHHVFWDQLNVDPEEQPVFISEPPLTPVGNRKLVTQLMFEKMQVPALHCCAQGVLELYASGRTSGLVVNSGDGCTTVTPIFEGCMVGSGTKRMNLAGMDVSNYLAKLIETSTGHSFTSPSELERLRDIKEKHCHIALDPDDGRKSKPVHYELPDGQIITLGNELYEAAELMFQPTLQNLEVSGIGSMVRDSLEACARDVRKPMYANILLAGGNTMFEGLKPRLLKELYKRSNKSTEIVVHAPDDRKNSCWIGASILTSMSSFEKMWITKKEYEEYGASIVNRKGHFV